MVNLLCTQTSTHHTSHFSAIELKGKMYVFYSFDHAVKDYSKSSVKEKI